MLILISFLIISEAKIAYRNGLYEIARIGFLEALKKGEDYAACYYYLTKISKILGDEVGIYLWGREFLSHYPIDTRAPEVAIIVYNSLLTQRWGEGLKRFIDQFRPLIKKEDLVAGAESLLSWGLPERSAEIILPIDPVRSFWILDSIKAYDRIRKLPAKDPDCYLFRAWAQLELGDTLNALFDFLRVDPNQVHFSDHYLKLALSFSLTRMADGVARDVADPLLKTEWALRRGLKEEARSYLSRLPPDTLIDHPNLCLEAGYLLPINYLAGVDTAILRQFQFLYYNLGRARECSIIAIILGSEDSLRLRARYFETRGKFDSALYYYRKIKDREGMARSLFHLGHLDEAKRLTRSDSLRYLISREKSIVIRNRDKAWAALPYARILLRDGDFEGAIRYLIKSRSPDRIPLLIKALTELGKDSLALGIAFSYQTKDPLGLEILYRFEQFDRLIKLTRDATDSLARVYRMKAYVRKGKIGKGKSLRKGLDPLGYYEALCEYLVRKRRFSKVDSILISLEESNERLRYLKSLLPFLRGQYDSAIVALKHYIKSGGEYQSKATFKLGTSYYQLGRFETAARYFRKLIHDHELGRDALHNLLICYKKLSDWDGIISLTPFIKGSDLFDLGYAYLRKGQYRKAISILEVVRREEYNPEVQYWLAEARSGAGDLRRALFEYYRLYLDFPKEYQWRMTAYFKMGLIMEIMGDYQGAKKVYQDIVKRGKSDVFYEEAKARLANLD